MTTYDEGFFGELYTKSTAPFLSDDVTSAEIAFLDQYLQEGLTLDLGCGHGRHLNGLSKRREVFGADRDQTSLVATCAGVRCTLEELPFQNGAFGNVYSWYNTLGTFENEGLMAVMNEVSRCLKAGGLFICQGTNRYTIEHQGPALFDDRLKTGCHLREFAVYNAALLRDEVERTLTLPDGRVKQAKFFIRYYDITQWRELLGSVGMKLTWVKGNVLGEAFDNNSPELIIGAHKL
jgi:SAM-dependent methyltransferase